MAKLFVSYSSKNRKMADLLVSDIKAIGHDVWFDQELSGGQAWWDHILETIRGCDLFVFQIDLNALTSVACKRELGYAIALGKPVLPVVVDEVSNTLLPAELTLVESIEYKPDDRKSALTLARALARVASAPPLPTPLPNPPEVPISDVALLNKRVDSTGILGHEEQYRLVVDLRRVLRDPTSAEDAYHLADRLRKRPDILAEIAQELDDIRRSRRVPLLLRSNRPTWRERKIGAGVTALACLVWTLLVHSYWAFNRVPWISEYLVFALFGAVTGVATGLLAGLRWRVYLGAVAGYLVFAVASLMFNNPPPEDAFQTLVSTALSAGPFGLIAGAAAMRNWRKPPAA